MTSARKTKCELSAQETGAHGDEDHSPWNVSGALVVSYKTMPAGHLAESPFSYPAALQRIVTICLATTVDNLDDEIQTNCHAHRLQAVIGEQMLHSWPTLADCIQDYPSVGTVEHIGQGQVDHQGAPVHIDGKIALALNDLPASVVTHRFHERRLDVLVMSHLRSWTSPAAYLIFVEYHLNII